MRDDTGHLKVADFDLCKMLKWRRKVREEKAVTSPGNACKCILLFIILKFVLDWCHLCLLLFSLCFVYELVLNMSQVGMLLQKSCEMKSTIPKWMSSHLL